MSTRTRSHRTGGRPPFILQGTGEEILSFDDRLPSLEAGVRFIKKQAEFRVEQDLTETSYERSPEKFEGTGWRVAVTIVAFFGALIAVVLWLTFYVGGLDVYQNIGVVAVILLAFFATMGATWAPWGMRQAARR